MVRPLLTSEIPSDLAIASVFRALNLPQQSFQAFRERVCEESAIAKSGGSEWLQGVLQETLMNTWFRMPHQRTVVSTSRGTRPGDCLADLLFAYVFSEVLSEIRKAFAHFPTHATLPWAAALHGRVQETQHFVAEDRLSVHDVTWMDDLCAVAAFSDAADMLQAFRGIAGQLLDSCLERGMQPNLKTNKTEVILGLNGKGARQLRAEYLSDADPSLAVSSEYWPEARVQVVAQYRHLGGVIHHKGGVEQEARARAAQAWQAFLKHRRTIFVHAQIALADKVSLFRTLVLSVLFHACGTWPAVSSKATAVLQRAYLNMARAMLAKHFRGDVLHLSEARVLALLQLPTVQTWLHFHRLSYLASFVALDVSTVWALAHAERHWLGLVRSSLCWLWEQVDGGVRTPSWEQAWERWRDDIHKHPRSWKSLIRFAVASATRVDIIEEGWQQCRGMLLKRLMRAGGVVSAWRDVFQSDACACGPCQKIFCKRQAWAVHAFKAHGRVATVRTLIQGEQCTVCLKTYPSHLQLCQHIQCSSYCRHQLQAQGFHCDPLPGRGNTRARAGRREIGVVRQGFGPRLPEDAIVVPREEDLPASTTWQALLHVLEVHSEAVSLVELLEAYRVALCSECLEPEILARIAQQWAAYVRSSPFEDMSIVAAAVHGRAAEWIVANLSAAWLCPHVSGKAEVQATFRHSLAGLAAIDLEAIEPMPVSEAPAIKRFVVCSGEHVSCAGDSGLDCSTVLTWDELAGASCWCSQVWDFVKHFPDGHVALSFAGTCSMPLTPVKPLKAAAFRPLHRFATFVQDAILLFVELWLQGINAAVLLPCIHESSVAVLKRLPGVVCTHGQFRVLVFCCKEAQIPKFLFHLL